MEWRVSIEDKNKKLQLSNRNSGRAKEVDGNKENTENTCPALSYNMVPVSEVESAGILLKRRWNQDENLAATAAMKNGTLMSKEFPTSTRWILSWKLRRSSYASRGRSSSYAWVVWIKKVLV
jgi:hypothetical protein